jgi:hypothetical protein
MRAEAVLGGLLPNLLRFNPFTANNLCGLLRGTGKSDGKCSHVGNTRHFNLVRNLCKRPAIAKAGEASIAIFENFTRSHAGPEAGAPLLQRFLQPFNNVTPVTRLKFNCQRTGAPFGVHPFWDVRSQTAALRHSPLREKNRPCRPFSHRPSQSQKLFASETTGTLKWIL